MTESKRILITSVNGLLGHCLFEQMRNDHLTIQEADKTPHRFLGTMNLVPQAGIVNPNPNESIKILDSKAKPKTFVKQVRGADYIILDISQFSADLEEAESVVKALRYHEDGVKPEKK